MSSIEKTLEKDGLIELKNGRYVQTGDNCYQIACSLAKKHGYNPPRSTGEIRDFIFDSRRVELWGGNPVPNTPSDACFVIHGADNPTDIHVAFEHNGKQFNYGANLPIERRLYLKK